MPVFPLLLVTACTRGVMNDDTGGMSETIDAGGDAEILNLASRAASYLPTVWIVSWDTTEPTSGWVEYGPDDQYGFTTFKSDTLSTHHDVVVAGMPFDSEWHWQAASELGNGTVRSADQTRSSGPPSPDAPLLHVDTADTSAEAAGFRIVPIVFGEQESIAIVNSAGELVWYLSASQAATQAIVAPDGSGIYYLTQDSSRETDLSEVRYSRWDGETSSVRAVGGHHDFTLLPDGRIAYVSIDVRAKDGKDVAGDALMVMAGDGSDATPIWSTWDNLPVPDFTHCFIGTDYPDLCDWTHANGVSYDPSDDTYLFSLHNENTVARISGTGETLDFIGRSSYATIQPASVTDGFSRQHGFKALGGNQYILFDNGAEADPGGSSRAMIITTDDDQGVYRTDWEYDWDGHHLSLYLGDHDLLPNGNHLISWGSEATVTEVTDSKQLVWEVGLNLGSAAGFSSYSAGLGGPSQ